MNNNAADTSVDLGLNIKWTVVYGIKSAPFFEGLRTFDEKGKYLDTDQLKAETGEYIFRQIKDFNNMDEVEKQKKN